MPFAYAFIIAYLLGALPTAYLMVKALTGQDIRKIGSGNVGATNVFRAAGKIPGISTYLLDGLKGWVATALVPLIWKDMFSGMAFEALQITCFFAAVVGHSWPVFLKFKGGKGVAVSSGALVGIAPLVFVEVFGVWLGVYLLSFYVSLASIAAAGLLPLFMFFNEASMLIIGFSFLLAGLVIYRHRTNIVRLIRGTETQTRFK